MKDALGDTPWYPNAPGFKEPTTSRDAAMAMTSTAENIRHLVLGTITVAGDVGMTADEVAAKLNLSILTVRPRVSELNRDHRIVKTGARRKNASGMSAHVWKVAPSQ